MGHGSKSRRISGRDSAHFITGVVYDGVFRKSPRQHLAASVGGYTLGGGILEHYVGLQLSACGCPGSHIPTCAQELVGVIDAR